MRSKLSILLLLSISLVSMVYGQDLITNGNFEKYRILPRFEGDLNSAKDWYTLVNSADYLNTSYNGWMPQFGGAHEGYGYVGLSSYNLANGASEAFGQEIDPDKIDPTTPYIIEFYGKGSVYGWNCAGISFYTFEQDPVANQFDLHISSLPGAKHLFTSEPVVDSFWTHHYSCISIPENTAYLGVTMDKVANCPQYIYVDELKIYPFVVDLGPDTSLCPGEALVLRSPFPKGTYQWEDGSSQQTRIVKKSGTYKLSVTIGSCTLSDDVTVSYRKPVTDKLGKDSMLCPGDSMLLTAPSDADSVKWSTGSTNSSIWARTTGMYTLTMFKEGCVFTDQLRVSVSNLHKPRLDKDSIFCPGFTIRQVAQQNGASYLWSNGSTRDFIDITHPGTYWVTVTKGHCTQSDTITIGEEVTSPLDIGPDLQWCAGDTFILTPAELDPSWKLRWSDQSEKPTLQITTPGTYALKADWKCGTLVDSVQVNEIECACSVFIPNAFTPNDLGENETFGPVADCYFTNYRFRVYNRWGQLLFESSHLDQKWDGAYLQNACPEDVYFYDFIYADGRKQRYYRYGTITLLR